MSKIIIGIHGLANKPPKETIESWWKQSLVEGLQKNCDYKDTDFDFKLVYWADLLHKYSLHNDQDFDFDELYNKQPYVEAKPGELKTYSEGKLSELRTLSFGALGNFIDLMNQDFGVSLAASLFIHRVFRDLDFYYSNNRQIRNRTGKHELARKVLRDELKNVLRQESNKEIMLIAHSMGSIISYDVLRDLGRSDPEMEIPHYVTIGSPLGLPTVKTKIIEERDYDARVRTPSLVTKTWVNYADKRDPVATDTHLADDYKANRKGIQVFDDLIMNDYELPHEPGKVNAHKSYGYLRTPELSNHVKSFLTGGI